MARYALMIALLMLVVGVAVADTNEATQNFTVGVAEISLLDIEGAADPIALNILTVTEAGTAPANVSAAGGFLNYTSIVDAGDTRTVKVSVSAIVDGCALSAMIAAPTATGSTNQTDKGAAVVKTEITTTPTDWLSGIKSCWTGDGDAAGQAVTYYLDIDDWAALHSIDPISTRVVTYTMTATDVAF